MADDKNLLGEKFTVTSLLESKPVLETYNIFSNIVSDLKVLAVLINSKISEKLMHNHVIEFLDLNDSLF